MYLSEALKVRIRRRFSNYRQPPMPFNCNLIQKMMRLVPMTENILIGRQRNSPLPFGGCVEFLLSRIGFCLSFSPFTGYYAPFFF